jgi:hypothetical protein
MGMVKLTMAEVLQGAATGTMRHMESVSRGEQHKPPLKPQDNGLMLHIEGACGEIAYAKWRGVYFDPRINSYKGADFGTNVQIRTRSNHDYELLIRDNDNPEHFYVLVTGMAPTYRVVGWIKGSDAMKPEWRKDWGGRGEAWFVPHSALTPFKAKDKAA